MAVKQNGKVLVFASEELRKDKDVVMAAVKQNGKALVFAHESLKSDKEIVMEAVAEGGHVALWHASEELQKDKEILSTLSDQCCPVNARAAERCSRKRATLR